MTYNLKKRRYWMGHRRALNGPARSPEGVRRDSLRLVNDRKVNDSRIGTVPYKIRPSRILHSENYDRFVETTSTARAAFFTRFEIIRDPEMALLQLRLSVRLSVRSLQLYRWRQSAANWRISFILGKQYLLCDK